MHRRAQCEQVKVHIQEVSTIVDFDPKAKPVFPLRETYDGFNSTFEGNLAAMAMGPATFENNNDRKGREGSCYSGAEGKEGEETKQETREVRQDIADV